VQGSGTALNYEYILNILHIKVMIFLSDLLFGIPDDHYILGKNFLFSSLNVERNKGDGG
jgi:hypothetical protein